MEGYGGGAEDWHFTIGEGIFQKRAAIVAAAALRANRRSGGAGWRFVARSFVVGDQRGGAAGRWWVPCRRFSNQAAKRSFV